MSDRRLWFAIPGDIDSLTGGYLYDKRMIAELRTLGWSVRHLAWPASFPLPAAEDLRLAANDLAACPDGATVMVDGLAFGVMPDLLAKEADRLRLVALVHHPLALETRVSADLRKQFLDLERQALQYASAVIVTSDMTAATLVGDYAVDPALITVVKPGVDRPRTARTTRPLTAVTRLLSIGSVTPRKGFDVLADALAEIADLDWTCTIAGNLERAPETGAALVEQIERLGLGDRVALAGERHDLAQLYENADIFVLASRYEGYGMVFAEAMTYGLPIVATHVGAIPEVVPAKAGILVPVDDPKSLAEALRSVITERDIRAGLVEGAAFGAALLPFWADSAARIASALDRLED